MVGVVYSKLLGMGMLQVRDSFVRQFMLETGDDEDLPVDKSGEESKGNGKVLYRKKQPLRLLNSVISTCVAGTNQKQNAITGIIKYVEILFFTIKLESVKFVKFLASESNNQRLLLGDSGPIPIIGTGKQGATGQKSRQDLKKYASRLYLVFFC